LAQVLKSSGNRPLAVLSVIENSYSLETASSVVLAGMMDTRPVAGSSKISPAGFSYPGLHLLTYLVLNVIEYRV
jgi:hypothetical protein